MRPKIIFLDLEGTIARIPETKTKTRVARSAWTTIAQRLGEDCLEREEQSKVKWEASGYRSYLDWMDESIINLKWFGLNEDVFKSVIDDIPLVEGIEYAAECFSGWGSAVCIITGGFKRLADRAAHAIRAKHVFASCEIFFDEGGYVSHWNLLPADYHGKSDFMRLMIREYGCAPDECVFVGDGNNDVHLATSVGVSIAFNAQEELRRVTTYSLGSDVNEVDFRGAVHIIRDHKH